MADDCCKTTEDGVTYCTLPSSGQSLKEKQDQFQTDGTASPLWQKLRGGAMFAVGCVLSPCCTPLLVPLGLALAAGTPFAVWASLNIGLVYGALTLLSIVSFIVGWHWLQSNKASTSDPKPANANLSIREHRVVETKQR